MAWLYPLDIGITTGLIFVWAVWALSIAMRLLNFADLTIEGSLPLGAAVFAVLRKNGYSLPWAILAGAASGAALGALTGWLHVRLRLNKFLAGILVVALAYTLSLRLMAASNIGLIQFRTIFDYAEGFDHAFGKFHPGRILLLLVVAIVNLLLWIYGLSTVAGIQMRAAATNPEHAQALGVDVSYRIVIGLALTNMLAAITGIFLAMYQGFADVNMGQGILILALAAMTIGERLLPEQRLPFPIFILVSSAIGSIVYQVAVAYAVRFGLASTDLKLVTALLVLTIVAVRGKRYYGNILTEDMR